VCDREIQHCCRYASTDWNKFIAQDRDLCQPLDGQAVCQSLNSSARICAPTGWAGDVIRKALNRTQSALSSLFESIELKLRRRSTHEARRQRHQPVARPDSNHSQRPRQPGQVRDDDLTGVVDAVELCAELACVALPAVAVLLVSRAAYTSYHEYVVDALRRPAVSDRLCVDVAAKSSNKSPRRSTTKTGGSTTTMSPVELRRAVEHQSVADAVFVVVLHLGFSATCCFFDVALYWLLAVVSRHTAPPPFDFTGADSVSSVTSGDGTIIAVLAEFLTVLHAGHWFGFTDSGYMCSVQPARPDYMTLVVVVVLYIALFVLLSVQSSVVPWQNHIAAYFYPQHEQSKRQFYGALVTAQGDRRVDDAGADQKEVLRQLMCVESSRWRPDTLLAVRQAATPVSARRRCVACGQPVSRRVSKARVSVRGLSTDDSLDAAEVCPVCDCRLTPDEDVVFSNAACCMSADITSRLA